jgi:type III secretion protein R
MPNSGAGLFPDPIAAFGVLTVLGLVPFLALVVTSFTKISVVLLLTRNALGVKEAPPNMVVNGFALILTLYVMAPVGQQAMRSYDMAGPAQPTMTLGTLNRMADAVRPPLTAFLKKHTNPRESRFFVRSARELWPKDMADALQEDSMLVLVPSFTVTELTAAFQIGFIIYLAFLVIDLVVASVLVALNMHMISPTVISVPVKILLFVALDGWTTLVHSLVLTYK